MIEIKKIRLDEIKVLIIEDEQNTADHIKKALLALENEIEEKFQEKNIHFYIVNPSVDNEGVNTQASATDIYIKTKDIIKDKKIDVLFIDLNLGRDTNQGINLIRQYMQDPSIALLPKYIITTETSFLQEEKDGVFKNTDIKQYTTIYKKPNTQSQETYTNLFKDNKITKTFPVLVEIYRKQKESITIDYLIEEFETKTMFMLSENQNSTDLIISNVNKVLNTIDSIDKQVENINQKTIAIEIITKSIAKALPKIGTKAKGKQLIEEWEKDDDLQKALGDDFPVKPEGFYKKLKDIAEEFSAKASEDIAELLYNAGKEYLEKKVDIQDDDSKLVMLTKYSAYFTEKVSDFVLEQ